MKISKQKMTEFLKKVNMNGDLQEAIFNFTETGLKISGKNAAGVTRVDGMLKSAAFEEYNALGKIGVQEINTVIRIMSGFNKIIDVKVEGNLLSLKEGGKKVDIELLDVQFIEEVQALPPLEFDENIKIASKDINDFIKDASINKEFFISLSTKEKVTMLTNTGKFKFTKTLETVEAKGGVTAKFGAHFINAVIGLTSDVTLSLKTDYPIKLVEITEESIISIVTAPVSGNEDAAKSEDVIKGSDEDIDVAPEEEQVEAEVEEEKVE